MQSFFAISIVREGIAPVRRTGTMFSALRGRYICTALLGLVSNKAREGYEQIPETLTLRELRFDVKVPGRRTEAITVVTTRTDPEASVVEDIAPLYGLLWSVELDIRAIKQSLGLDHLRCKPPHRVHRELWVTLLAYNLIRKVIATAATMHDKQPRRLSFTLTCQTVLALGYSYRPARPVMRISCGRRRWRPSPPMKSAAAPAGSNHAS